MKLKITIVAVVLASALAIWVTAPAAGANTPNTYQPLESVLLPLWASEPETLTALGSAPLLVGDQSVGTVVAYDDANTGRAADYLELYDNHGRLVAVGWFDRFGIERIAVDRGLVEQREDLEGVFVVFLQGEAV